MPGRERACFEQPGAGQADVRVLDLQVLHDVENPELVVDGRVFDAGVLQAVAKGLVEEGEGVRDHVPFSIELVPIEN